MRNLLALVFFVPSLCLAQLPDYVPSEGLVLFMNFDGNTQDESGNGSHGTPTGLEYSTDRFGNTGMAAEFGIDRWIEIPHSEAINFASGDSLTWSVWMKTQPTSAPYGQVICQKWNGSLGTSYPLSVGCGNQGNELGSATFCEANQSLGHHVSTTIEPSSWTHGLMTQTPDSVFLYVNGSLVETSPVTHLGCGNTVSLLLGRKFGSIPAYYVGELDEFGLWTRVLSHDEIAGLHLSSSLNAGCSDPEACNFQPDADTDDGSCDYGCLYCGEGTVWDSTMQECVTDLTFPTAPCGEGTVWDPVNEECIIAIPADLNYDGCVSVNDLLVLLAVHGTCPPYPEWPDEPTDTTWNCGDSTLFDNYWYETVLIGNQCWFAENLRTTVYRNSDAIPAGLTDDDWLSTTSGATAVYGEGSSEGSSNCSNYSPDIDACDDAQSLAEYGRLYNWYAVDDARGLCPSGWHAPTDEEWTDLENHISSQGFSYIEGTALKSTSGWWSDPGNGTDDFGFSALPGGSRNYDNGYFRNAGLDGNWWSSSPSGSNAWSRGLGDYDPWVYRSNHLPRSGFSVRCLRDAD